MPQPNITVFTKPDCSYCTRAKAVLNNIGYAYQEYDVTANSRNADAAVYFSGASVVPQIFFGNYHINGAEDLEKLQASGQIKRLIVANKDSTLPIDTVTNEDLHAGIKDYPLRSVVPKVDGSHSKDPETWASLHFYKALFGFWPNAYAYLYHWPDAYKLFLYCHMVHAVEYGKQNLGMTNMFAVAYATSNAHGCAYCQTHSIAAQGENTLKIPQQLEQVRKGKKTKDNPFDYLSVSMADLAADATRNRVKKGDIARIIGQTLDSANAESTTETYLEGIEMTVANLGFLNVFNDLTGVELEGNWAEQASKQGVIDTGSHPAQSENPSNLDYDIPTSGPSLAQMMAKYEAAVGDLTVYARREFGLLPDWIKLWPKHLEKFHAYLYGEVMGSHSHNLLSSELKHLMARVSAISKDHYYLSTVEGFMAHHTATDKPRSIERIRHCFEVASRKQTYPNLFDKREEAALQLAWLSAQMPLKKPHRFMQSIAAVYSAKELVHLSVVCAVASMVQRFVAIVHPEIEPEVSQFMQKQKLMSSTLGLRYPLQR
ncbi:MAG: glutaredoxin domain-containing protein [Cyanobacteria bacterium J06621_11]